MTELLCIYERDKQSSAPVKGADDEAVTARGRSTFTTSAATQASGKWLGANTEDYYAVLAKTGHGSWQPRDDAHLWLTFNLRAHHMQAQTVARRAGEAAATWAELDELATAHGLPERTLDAMFDATLDYRVRRGGYIKRTQITEQTATRDLAALASAGALAAHGNGRGRYYSVGEPLLAIQRRRREGRQPLRDPYPWLRAKLAEPV
jgi:hypothetical protein